VSIKVVYSSRTGNTEKLAKAIAEAVGAKAERVEECRIGEDVELLFIGGAVYATYDHNFSPSIKAFLEYLVNLFEEIGKIPVVFRRTLHDRRGAQKIWPLLIHERILSYCCDLYIIIFRLRDKLYTKPERGHA
jgi:hypothetical protein